MSEQETRKRAERIGEQYTRRGIPVITTEETIAEVKKIGFLTAEETLLNRVIELEAEVSRLTQERDEAQKVIREALYGKAGGGSSLFGNGHVAKNYASHISRWFKDPNCDVEETAKRIEAALEDSHQRLLKIASLAARTQKQSEEEPK